MCNYFSKLSLHIKSVIKMILQHDKNYPSVEDLGTVRKKSLKIPKG
jgi:hypothetical protein